MSADLPNLAERARIKRLAENLRAIANATERMGREGATWRDVAITAGKGLGDLTMALAATVAAMDRNTVVLPPTRDGSPGPLDSPLD